MANVDPKPLIQAATREVETVTVAEAAQKHADGAQFVDVREPEEWLQGYVAGALHIPRGTLEFDIGDQVRDPRRHLVTYCGSGARAVLAAAQLKRLGFENAAAMIDGGYDNWSEAGYPTAHNPLKPLLNR